MGWSVLLFLFLSGCHMRFASGSKEALEEIPQHPMKTFYDFSVQDIQGQEFSLSQFKGYKVLLVNTASKCGYTSQYAELEELYKANRDSSFIILGFPCDDFGGQEPGSEAEIAEFCSVNYGVSFPMMSKVSIKGDKTHDLYHWLQRQELNGKDDFRVSWNFCKFLINTNGSIETMYPSSVSPLDEKILLWLKR